MKLIDKNYNLSDYYKQKSCLKCLKLIKKKVKFISIKKVRKENHF